MINPEQYGVEEGDTIRITIEGVVEKTDPYDHWPYSVNGFGIGRTPATVSIEPTVEILKKAEPKWHSAQVIRAKGFLESWPATPAYEGVFMRRENSILWIDPSGESWGPEELRDVEVIVQ